jgi:hypothetical protein
LNAVALTPGSGLSMCGGQGVCGLLPGLDGSIPTLPLALDSDQSYDDPIECDACATPSTKRDN